MSNVISPQPARAKASASAYPLRGTLKGALATLVLLLLALLFWQLLDQLQQTRKNQRQQAIDYSAELADHLSLNLALNAQIALNLLPIVESPQDSQQQQQLLHKLQRSLPDVRSFALLDASGQILSDSASDSHDAPWLAELIQRSHLQRYYYSNPADGSVVHVLLHQSSGASPSYWVLRLAPSFLQTLVRQSEGSFKPTWVIENRLSRQVIKRDEHSTPTLGMLEPDEMADSALLVPLSNSDWQLRGLFDQQAVIE